MKIIFFSVFILTAISCSSYRRLGDLNMVSNRNIDSSQKYELLQRNVKAKCRIKNNNSLEIALDRVVENYRGEYLMNAKIYIKKNMRKIMIEGDVWGIKETQTD